VPQFGHARRAQRAAIQVVGLFHGASAAEWARQMTGSIGALANLVASLARYRSQSRLIASGGIMHWVVHLRWLQALTSASSSE
jgi:hypothetical protein